MSITLKNFMLYGFTKSQNATRQAESEALFFFFLHFHPTKKICIYNTHFLRH